MTAADYVGIATLITALGAAVVSIVVALRQSGVKQQIDAVHEEVKTGNGLTIGMLAGATEARRTDALPPPPAP